MLNGNLRTNRRQVSKETVFYLYECDPNGHRITFLLIVARHLQNEGIPFVLLVTDSVRVELEKQDANLTGNATVQSIKESHSFRSAARICGEKQGALIVLDGDPHLAQSVWASVCNPRVTIHLLVMQNPWWVLNSFRDYPAGQIIRNILKLVLVWTLIVAPSRLNIKLLTYPRPLTGPRRLSSRLVEDPVLVESFPQGIPNRPPLSVATTWIGIVGTITARKNPELLVQALELLASRLHQNVGVALMGPIGADVIESVGLLRSRLDRLGVSFIVDNRSRTNEQMNADIQSLDIVCMLYSTSAPNSTAAKAAFYGKRVLAAGPRQYRRFVERIALCETSELDPCSVAARLEELLNEVRPARVSYSAPEGFAEKVIQS